jgi:basic membrane lipoprotein Med (substrate-binding protein (PBP1-ABC) superfamily)
MSIVPIWLHHKDNPDKKVAVYALLDKASGGTFIKQEILKKLGVKESYTKLQLTTMHGTKKGILKMLKG